METRAQNKTINVLYAILVFSTILGFVPNATALILSIVLWFVVLIAAYMYRSKDNEDGLLYNHMTYLIGTIWIGTSFILLGTLLAGLWVFLNGDNTAIDGVISQIENGAMVDEAQMTAIVHNYITANQGLLWTASIVAIGPAILYFVYRVANGLSRAGKGYRIANPKSWL